MKKYSCGALQGDVLCSPQPGCTEVSFMCIVCALLLWLSHALLSFQPCAMTPFGCCEQDLFPVWLMAQSVAVLGLSRIKLGILQS